MTLVVAPAGAGKTSLLAGWAAEYRPSRWPGCRWTKATATPPALWRGVIAALDTLAPGCGDGAQAALRAPGTILEVVGQLLDDLDEPRRPAPCS